jgi:thiamine pyrophosphate-dependent acetolactate synthase large subunit-like protein
MQSDTTQLQTTKLAEPKAQEEQPSRRGMLTGAAAAAAALGTVYQGVAQAAPPIASIKIPAEVEATLKEPAKVLSFEGRGLTGAEVFAKLCKEEGLEALFCAAGNYTVINALAAAGIPTYGGRTEGNMCAAADGFSRVTGEVAACSGTEGPGFLHMIMNIAQASAARQPLLVLASNMQISGDDRETFVQTFYQQPVTEGMKKYGKRLTAPNRVWEYGAYAFRHLKTGVPGPVHLDFPGEVARARFTDPATLTDYYTKEKYRTESRPCCSNQEVDRALDLLAKAERPLIVAGQGVFQRKAWEPLMQAAERNQIAVVTSGPMRGHFPDDHRLSVATAPDSMMSADLVIFIGQYSMPSPGEYKFNPDVKAIRVHPAQEDLGRNWPLDLGIVSDERVFLEAFANRVPQRKRDPWVNEIAAARQKFEKRITDEYELCLKHTRSSEHLHPAVIGKELHDFMYKGKIDPKAIVNGGGGWTSAVFGWRWLRANRPGQQMICGYQLGCIGPDLAMTFGAGVAVDRGIGPQKPYQGAPVLVLTSDAGMGYSLMELDTAMKYKVPVITVVYNNNCWGTFTQSLGSPRSLHMYLMQENIRYDRMAEAMGAHGAYCRTPEDLREALSRAYDVAVKERVSSLINCQGLKEFTTGRQYPPGIALNPEPGVGAFAH